MQHVDCTGYPVVGWLIHASLDKLQTISRTTLAATAHGSINLYFHQGTYILECDTNGDHNPNDYYLFGDGERGEIMAAIRTMGKIVGLAQDISEQTVDHAIGYVRR